jgi:beta-fructofuranosidase
MSGGVSQNLTPMRTSDRSRREFLKASASAAAFASVKQNLSVLHALGSSTEDVLRARLAADPLRPQFHLLPAQNWMNDPNGPIYWKGHYHMFFQYNPNAAVWGDMHWAHAISDDLIHWRLLPVALAPTPGWDDSDGCFTGSAVDDHGIATILYTGVKTVAPERATLRDGVQHFREVQCLATSNDPLLRTWNKWKTPVIEPPSEPNLTGFRDPFLLRGSQFAEMGRALRSSRQGTAAALQDRGGASKHADWWYLGVASGIRKEGGRVLLYRSKDLRSWEYLHPLASGKWTGHESVNPVDSGEMWECPDFFPLGGKHVLLYSTAGGVYWESGELDAKEMMFHSQKRGILDHGAYYAQKTQLDAYGNRILWGWITEKRSDDELRAAGWAGCMALPRVLSLSADGELEMQVIPGVQSLRGESFHMHGFSTAERISLARKFEVRDIAGEFFWRSSAPRFTLSLADRTGIWASVSMDVESSAAKLTVNGTTVELPATQSPNHQFRLFLDGSVAELICNNRHAITSRIYRKPDGPLHISTESTFPEIHELNMWQLRPISNNRLTT